MCRSGPVGRPALVVPRAARIARPTGTWLHTLGRRLVQMAPIDCDPLPLREAIVKI